MNLKVWPTGVELLDRRHNLQLNLATRIGHGFEEKFSDFNNNNNDIFQNQIFTKNITIGISTFDQRKSFYKDSRIRPENSDGFIKGLFQIKI